MKKILTIGGAMQDIFIHYDPVESIHLETEDQDVIYIALEEGRKIEVDRVTEHTGGGSTNTAFSFQKLGFDVESFFKIGYDEAGRYILEQLKKRLIKCKSVARDEHAATGTSYIIPNHQGRYAILVHRGANILLTAQDIPFRSIEECDQVYITSLSNQASDVLPLITKQAKQLKKPVAVNPGTSQLTSNVKTLQEALPTIDTLILNCYEAHLLMQSMTTSPSLEFTIEITKDTPELLCSPLPSDPLRFSLLSYFKQIMASGPSIAVVTNGAEGVYVTNGDNIFFHPSIAPRRTVTALGAGDAFGSTFIAFLLGGSSIEDAIRAGVINSSRVLEHLDATTGLQTKEMLEAEIKEIDPALLQIFPMRS